jgi:hypothetical protein
LICYVEHPRSGALELDDMGASWVTVREAVTAGRLRATDKAAPDVAAEAAILVPDETSPLASTALSSSQDGPEPPVSSAVGESSSDVPADTTQTSSST